MNPGRSRNQASVRNPVRPLRTHEWDMMPLEENEGSSEERDQAASIEAERAEAAGGESEEEYGGTVHEKVARQKPTSPSKRECELHEASHVPFRSWCESCVAGRGRVRRLWWEA